MDEKQIAEQLAAKVNPPVPPPATEEPEIPEEPKDTDFHNNLPLENTFEKQQLMDYFMVPQISRHTAEIGTWLNDVLEWAKTEADSNDFNKILKVLSDQEMRMGNKLKPDRLLHLWHFVKINRQRKQLEEREKILYGE